MPETLPHPSASGATSTICEAIKSSSSQKDQRFENLFVAIILSTGQLITQLWRAASESPSSQNFSHLRLPNANLYLIRTVGLDEGKFIDGLFSQHTGTRLSVSCRGSRSEEAGSRAEVEALKPELTLAGRTDVRLLVFADRTGAGWVRKMQFDAQDALLHVGPPQREAAVGVAGLGG